MPCFEFVCPEDGCTSRAQEWRPKWTPDRPTCPSHAKEMERDWHGEARRHTPGSAFPYITKNITGSPVEVRDEGHLRELCKIHGVIPRNDAAWTEPANERWEQGRFNWKTEKWEGQGYVRKEGSGRGLPGTWF